MVTTMKFLDFLNENNVSDLTEPKVSYEDYGKAVSDARKTGLNNVDESIKILKKIGFDVHLVTQPWSEPGIGKYNILRVVSKDWQKVTIMGQETEVKIANAWYDTSSSRNEVTFVLTFKDKLENVKKIETEIRKVNNGTHYYTTVESKEINTRLDFDKLVKNPSVFKKMLTMVDFEFID